MRAFAPLMLSERIVFLDDEFFKGLNFSPAA